MPVVFIFCIGLYLLTVAGDEVNTDGVAVAGNIVIDCVTVDAFTYIRIYEVSSLNSFIVWRSFVIIALGLYVFARAFLSDSSVAATTVNAAAGEAFNGVISILLLLSIVILKFICLMHSGTTA